MIIAQQLKNQMVMFKVKLKGVQWFLPSLTANDIENQIEADITSYFTSIKKININVEIEEIEDFRTTLPSIIFNIEMLIIFNQSVDNVEVEIIENYLWNNFVKEF